MSFWAHPSSANISQDFNYFTIDRFGMMAIHTARPRYYEVSGKWNPPEGARRQDLGLCVHIPTSAGSTLEVRPGAEPKKDPKQATTVVVNKTTPEVAYVPQDVRPPSQTIPSLSETALAKRTSLVDVLEAILVCLERDHRDTAHLGELRERFQNYKRENNHGEA